MPFWISVQDMKFDYDPLPPSEIHCPECRCRTVVWRRPYQDRTRKLRHAIQGSYDGERVVSEEFKASAERLSSTALDFEKIYQNAYVIRCRESLRVDEIGSEVRRRKLCPTCGQYKAVLLQHPRFLDTDRIQEFGLYFSDVKFGNCPMKHPELIAGDRIGQALAAEFRAVYLHPLRED